MGSFMLPHLQNGWEVDQAILKEEEKLVVSVHTIEIDCTLMAARSFLVHEYAE